MVGFWFNAFGLVGAVWIGLRLCVSVRLGLRFPAVDVRLCVGLWRIERLQRFFGGVRFRLGLQRSVVLVLHRRV